MYGIHYKLSTPYRYYIVLKGSDVSVSDVTVIIMNKLKMPAWFQWEHYEIICK